MYGRREWAARSKMMVRSTVESRWRIAAVVSLGLVCCLAMLAAVGASRALVGMIVAGGPARLSVPQFFQVLAAAGIAGGAVLATLSLVWFRPARVFGVFLNGSGVAATLPSFMVLLIGTTLLCTTIGPNTPIGVVYMVGGTVLPCMVALSWPAMGLLLSLCQNRSAVVVGNVTGLLCFTCGFAVYGIQLLYIGFGDTFAIQGALLPQLLSLW